MSNIGIVTIIPQPIHRVLIVGVGDFAIETDSVQVGQFIESQGVEEYYSQLTESGVKVVQPLVMVEEEFECPYSLETRWAMVPDFEATEAALTAALAEVVW